MSDKSELIINPINAEINGEKLKHKVVETYEIEADGVSIEVSIIEKKELFVREYYLNFPEYGEGTKALLKNLKSSIITESTLKTEKMLDPNFIISLKKKFSDRAMKILSKEMPNMDDKTKRMLTGILIHEMLGLGKIEFLLNDNNLEEMVINQSHEPVWVYHKKYGWLRTNIYITPEEEIVNYASIIARRIGKQITTLAPLLDAHLITGDRANATLFPISTKGNTITIRKFRRDPWTVTDLIKNGTTSADLMSLLWLAIEYELNVIFSGGTASGKTTMLGSCLPFIQPNHRIISIEDTRELQAPDYLHWVPLTTREPNPEGKGGVSMLDLLVNSLRMRPDRVLVGEVRRQREAEVMFEAMHTGHSVYTTVHANTADETIRRLINPPIAIAPSMLDSVHLNVVMFRNRRIGARRVLQVAEFIPEKRGADEERIKPNVIYRWRPADDKISKHSESVRLFDELALHTGLSSEEINRELKKKKQILEWMVKYDVRGIEKVGKTMAEYYMDPDSVFNYVEKDKKPVFK